MSVITLNEKPFLLSVNEIKNEKVREKFVEYYDKAQATLISIIPHVPKFKTADLVDLNIIEEIKITMENDSAYEDDGNTSCPGREYMGFVSFPLVKEAQYDRWNVYHGHAIGCVSFCFKMRDRVSDGKLWEGMSSFEGILYKFKDKQGQNEKYRFCHSSSPSATERTHLVREMNDMYDFYELHDKFKKALRN